ncbi:MAG: hypothetical protein M3Q06_07455 [Bacteroidota bacterium]|nr:hypothetical protein [Bacteroidota bacterium]
MATATKKGTAAKKGAAKKSTTKKSAAKKGPTKRTTTKKATAKKQPAEKAATEKSAAKKGSNRKNKLGVKNSLVNNINAHKEKGDSKSRKKSTVSTKSYKKMEQNWGREK